MYEEKRELVNNAMIINKLTDRYGKKLLGTVIGLVLFIPLIAIVLYLGKDVMLQTGSDTLYWVLNVCLLLATVVYAVIIIVRYVKCIRSLRAGEFLVERVEFLRHVEYDTPRTLFSYGSDAIYFTGGKKHTIKHYKRHNDYSERLLDTLKFTAEGDMFWVVVFPDKPNDVIDLYAEKIFVYKNTEVRDA